MSDYFTFVQRRNAVIIKNTITTFCRINGVEQQTLDMTRRDRHLVETRTLIWNFLREHTKMSLKHLGKLFNRDHATVLHAIRRHRSNLEEYSNGKPINQEYKEKWEDGCGIIIDLLKQKEMYDASFKYRVVLYTNDPIHFTKHQVISTTEL